MTVAQLMVAGGSGRLVRRPSVALFDPDGGNADLAEMFAAAADDGAAVIAVKKHLIDGGFDASPLVVVQWAADHIDLLVFGEVEVHTSAIAAPMVTGAGSATWIEHHLGAIEMGSATEVELWSGDDVDEATDLQAGAVRVGAFRLALSFDQALSPAAAVEPEQPAAEPAEEPEPSPSAAAAPPEPPPIDATDAPAAPPSPSVEESPASPTAPPAAPPAPPVEEPPAAPTAPPGGSSPFDAPVVPPAPAVSSPPPPVGLVPSGRPAPPPPAGAASAPAAGSPPPPVGVIPAGRPSPPPPPVGVIPAGRPSPPPPPGAPEMIDDLATVPPTPIVPNGAVAAEATAAEDIDPFTTGDELPASLQAPAPLPAFDADPPTEPEPDLAESDVDPPTSDLPGVVAGGLVEAADCPSGHPNPPRSETCYVCGADMGDDQSLKLIEQPIVGRIMFSSGQGLELAQPVKMGRKPDSGEGVHPVVIDHVEVSRAHATISVEGWTVLLTDEGSRNGTWVTPASDPTPVRLEAEVPHVLEDGDTVHLGGPEVAFTYHFDAEPV